MKILLAEDHDHLREILEDYLVENDYEVKSIGVSSFSRTF